MSRHLSLLAVLSAAALLSVASVGAMLVAPAAAQQGNETATASADCERPEAIDASTRLCSADLVDGRAVLELESERRQTVVLSDMADFANGGVVDQRSVTLRADERTTVRWSVSRTDRGQAGVSVETSTTLYAVPLETSTPLIGGPWSARDAQAAALGSALVVSGITLGLAWRRIRGPARQPRRLG